MQSILAVDVGGTKTWLRLMQIDQTKVRLIKEERVLSPQYPDLFALLKDFLPAEIRIDAACFGVPGPVEQNRARLTNLPWQVDAQDIAHCFSIAQVNLINDFAAVAYGIAGLADEDLYVLQKGQPRALGVKVVTGAGTGLGVATLIFSKDDYVPLASEGGHVDFAPRNKTQGALLDFLLTIYPQHVSYERLLTGSGLSLIYRFVSRGEELQPALITEQALNQTYPHAIHALDLFIDIYGAYAGNLALTLLPQAGMYIAGGIAPKILAALRSGRFMHAFVDKGRYKDLLSRIPVAVIVNEKVGLLGAYRYALANLRSQT